MREAHISSNDLAVRWIQDLLTAIGAADGEEAVGETFRVSYEHIWKTRYELWFRPSPRTTCTWTVPKPETA